DVHVPGGLALGTERNDVLDYDVDSVADLDRVREAVFLNVERSPLDAHELAEQRPERSRGTSEGAAEYLRQRLDLLVAGVVADDDTNFPVAFGHELRRICDHRGLGAANIDAVYLTALD